MTHEAFLNQCRGWLAAREMEVLERALLDVSRVAPEGPGCRALTLWLAYENTVRNTLARLRAKRLDKPPDPWLRRGLGVDAHAGEHARAAMDADNPLDVEIRLLNARWRFLDQVCGGAVFSLCAVVVYSLKLQILNRYRQFDEKQGEDALERVYERIFDGSERKRDDNGDQR